MKRMVALLLGIALLLMSVAAADDDLNEIAARVENYLEDMTDDAGTQTLEECLELLKNVGNGPSKKALEIYCKILLNIAKENFDDANQSMYTLTLLKKNFEEEFIEHSAGITSFLTVDELGAYLQGREAEYYGDWDAAMTAYEQCAAKADVLDRMMTIEGKQYGDAIDLIDAGRYDEAHAMLEKLAERNYSYAKQMLRDWATPTPKPTATPTPKPTATPTATPKETATPTPVLTTSPMDEKYSQAIDLIVEEKDSEAREILESLAEQNYAPAKELLSQLSWETSTPKPTAALTPMSMVIPTVMPKIELDLWTSYVQIDEVRLDWKCSASGVPYKLQRQEGWESSNWVTILQGRTDDDTNFCFDGSVTEGKTYSYRIVVGGQSSKVLIVNIPKPTVAINLQVVQFVSNNSLKLTWEPKQNVTYKLQRQEGENNKWTTIYTGASIYFYDRGLTPGQTYRYRVIVGSLNIASEEITMYIDP